MLDWTDYGCGHGWTPPDDATDVVDVGAGAGADEVVGGPAPVGWAGDRLRVDWFEPNLGSDQPLGDYDIEPGRPTKIETPIANVNLYISTSGVTLENNGDSSIAFDLSDKFVGFKITDLSGTPIEFATVNINSTIRLDPEGLQYGDNFVQVDLLETTGLRAGGVLNVDVRFAG